MRRLRTDRTAQTIDNTALAATGRYVRINGTARATVWDYSLLEFEVFSS